MSSYVARFGQNSKMCLTRTRLRRCFQREPSKLAGFKSRIVRPAMLAAFLGQRKAPHTTKSPRRSLKDMAWHRKFRPAAKVGSALLKNGPDDRDALEVPSTTAVRIALLLLRKQRAGLWVEPA